MSSTLTSSLVWSRAHAVTVYDPAVLDLEIWVRANYTASPWTGTASAGSSGSRNLTEATNAPGTVTVNSLTGADFDGTNDILANATAISSLIGGGDYTLIILANVDAVTGGSGGFGDFMSDSGGYWDGGFRTSGVTQFFWEHFDGSYKNAAASASTGAWQACQVNFSSGTGELFVRVNGGSWSSATATAGPDVTTGTLQVGKNYSGVNFLNGKILELMIADSTLSTATIDEIRGYFNSRYAISV